jgi:threonine synthase
MGLELAEQSDWKLPDVIVYPTGGGSGIVGLWKAFEELRQLGWLQGPLPRFVSVQETGCSPIVEAVQSGMHVTPTQEPVRSSPTGLRVPNPPDGDLIATILRQTSGTAIAVSSQEIAEARSRFGLEGISSSPEGAATLAGMAKLRESCWIGSHDSVVLFNTSHADKYLPWRPNPEPPVVHNYADLRTWLRPLSE